jgi:hypothetical protein
VLHKHLWTMNIAIKPENISSRDAFADKVSLVRAPQVGSVGMTGALAAAESEIVLNRFGKPEEMLVGRRGDRLLVM